MQNTTYSKSTNLNFDTINKYIKAMKTENNLGKSHETNNRVVLGNLSKFHKNKSFIKMTRDDIIAFLDSFRKSESKDPFHRWIGTYNQYLVLLIRFFKWIYNPGLESKQRPKPEVMQNLHHLKRREQSAYKPTDLWTLEDDFLYLKFCPNVRNKCYHTVSRDLSARPTEILNLKIKDIKFQRVGDRQYAEVLVNGKTGTRHLPLIDSLPYLKDWLDQHPQRNNPNAFLICSMDRRNFAGQMTRFGMREVYETYRNKYFPRLLDNPDISTEDKDNLRELLKKPWNLFIRRHSALTEKSKFLRETTLRQHAGWTPRSQMHQKYVHYFGNESNNSILQEYGILPKVNEEIDVLRPKNCPSCNEPNRPDQKFCVKCKMVLTYDAYNETIEKEQKRESELNDLKKKLEAVQEEQNQKFNQIVAMIQRNPKLASIKPEVLTSKKYSH